MEDDQLLNVSGFGKLDGFLPGGVAPADLAVFLVVVFVIGIGAVINHDVGILNQRQNVVV